MSQRPVYRPQSRSWAFNLLEVTIAAFIFSAVSISFVGVWGQQVRALEKSRHLMVATFLAEELVEESMAKGYNQTKLTPQPEDIETDTITMTTETRNAQGVDQWDTINVDYTWTREVRLPPNSDPDNDKIKQVIVKVNWTDTTKTGEIVLETLLAGS